MRKHKFKISILIILILFIGSLIISYLLNPNSFEIRHGFLNNLLTGALSFWIVTGFLVLIVVRNIKRENKKGKSGLSSFILIILSLISLIVTLLFSIWLPPEKKDAIVFVNLNNPHEKLICQFYLSGITENNPNWRLISTKNQTGLIRRIEVLNDSTFSTEIELSEFPINDPKVHVVKFKNKKYKLQSYMIMIDWTTWHTYNLQK